ncbi:MAG: hypothetical protein ACAH80_12465 [Alphaproteobacteria bacterium]
MSEQQSLAEEFNTTAAKYMKGEAIHLEALVLKYSTLQRYKLDDASAKKETTETLYRCGVDQLKAVSNREPSNNFSIHSSLHDITKQIFDTILQEGQAVNIPAVAPQELSSISLQLLRHLEALDPKNFAKWDKSVDSEAVTSYRKGATALAAFTLQCADMLREALKETTGNVTTSQPVTTSRPIQLKQNTGAPDA